MVKEMPLAHNWPKTAISLRVEYPILILTLQLQLTVIYLHLLGVTFVFVR